jgi:type IV pilus assembly protein PilA
MLRVSALTNKKLEGETMRKQKGFSLIELLIVVAIILIIAAIAIPNLIRAKISANQASAVASVRTITTSQIQYQSNYPQVGFATTALALGTGAASSPPTACPGNPTSAVSCLIDGALTAASGSFPKSGYDIDTAGVPNAATPPINTTFLTRAGPDVYNHSGLTAFCSVEDGVLKQNTANVLSGLAAGPTYALCSTGSALWIPVGN